MLVGTSAYFITVLMVLADRITLLGYPGVISISLAIPQSGATPFRKPFTRKVHGSHSAFWSAIKQTKGCSNHTNHKPDDNRLPILKKDPGSVGWGQCVGVNHQHQDWNRHSYEAKNGCDPTVVQLHGNGY
jgi:hypothetical protein